MKEIKDLIYKGKIDQAIDLLNNHVLLNPADDEAWYLRGNAYRKKEDFQQALNNYLQAMELNPDSPAVEAHKMLMEILNYYNKDTYNP